MSKQGMRNLPIRFNYLNERSLSVCVSLMSHVLELYSLIFLLVTSSRIGKAGVRMLYITAAILYRYKKEEVEKSTPEARAN